MVINKNDLQSVTRANSFKNKVKELGGNLGLVNLTVSNICVQLDKAAWEAAEAGLHAAEYSLPIVQMGEEPNHQALLYLCFNTAASQYADFSASVIRMDGAFKVRIYW